MFQEEKESNRSTKTFRGLDTVLVKKEELITKLESNRATHVSDYNTAMDGYKVTLESRVKELIKNGKKTLSTIEEYIKDPEKIWNLNFYAPQRPQSHEEEYNQAIEQLVMSIDDHIELTQEEFRSYVMDNWSWKKQFAATSSFYANNMTIGNSKKGK